MKYRLINIGRGKYCGEVEAGTPDELAKKAGQHLMSNDIDIESQDGGKTWTVYAGLRAVGSIELIEEKNALAG